MDASKVWAVYVEVFSGKKNKHVFLYHVKIKSLEFLETNVSALFAGVDC